MTCSTFFSMMCLVTGQLVTVGALVSEPSVGLSRRGVLEKTMLSTASIFGGGMKSADAQQEPVMFDSYRVVSNANSATDAKLQSIKSRSFLDKLGSIQSGALWLGEHHNAKSDHQLQSNLLRELHVRRRGGKLAVGLEQIQIKFQPILDQFMSGDISLQAMRRLTEYDRRWAWPFELYEPVFATAKALEIPLIALNVNSEDLACVERGGLPGLPRDRLNAYIGDAPGFADFVRPRQFRTYVDYLIEPSYKLHRDLGLLKHTMSGQTLDQQMSFRNFLSGRLLWDESMAYHAYKWTQENPGGLMVGLVGADHVKFRQGIPGRYSRMAGNEAACVSVLLNPTLIDSRPPGLVAMSAETMTTAYPDRITLQIHYKDGATSGVLPLADYLMIG